MQKYPERKQFAYLSLRAMGVHRSLNIKESTGPKGLLCVIVLRTKVLKVICINKALWDHGSLKLDGLQKLNTLSLKHHLCGFPGNRIIWRVSVECINLAGSGSTTLLTGQT